MAYFYIILLTFLFSFGGILIKTSGLMFSPLMISFLRFAIGVVLLIIIELIRNKRVNLMLINRLILIGGAAKAINYLLENYGVMKGFSYGNVIVWPVQALTALFAGIFLFHEKVSLRSIIGAFLCVVGIVTVSLNGTGLSGFSGGQAALLPVFIVSGMGGAVFTICQKMMINKASTVESNLSMFLYGGGICFFPAAFAGTPFTDSVKLASLFCIFVLGAITGIGFLLQAQALKKIPIFMVTMIQSTTVILTLVWAVLIFGEPVTPYIASGVVIFVIGMLLINLKLPRRAA